MEITMKKPNPHANVRERPQYRQRIEKPKKWKLAIPRKAKHVTSHKGHEEEQR
jgi:stalled ribosome alternative rescue factor ArfA